MKGVTWKSRVCPTHNKRVGTRLQIDAAWCTEPDCWRDTMARAGWLSRNGWRSVETAPQDGSEVLVWRHDALEGRGRVDIATLDVTLGTWWDVAGLRIVPTHWMPMPDPPTVTR